MPLQELTTNTCHSKGHIRTASKANSEAVSHVSSIAPPPPPPSAVQSMLKNTTELGDLGLSTIYHNRPMRNSQQQPDLRRHVSLTASLRSDSHARSSLHHPQHWQPRARSQQQLRPPVGKHMHSGLHYQGRVKVRPPPMLRTEPHGSNMYGRRFHDYRRFDSIRNLEEVRGGRLNPTKEGQLRPGYNYANHPPFPLPPLLGPQVEAPDRISMASSSASAGYQFHHIPRDLYTYASRSSASLHGHHRRPKLGDNQTSLRLSKHIIDRSRPHISYEEGERYATRSLVSVGSPPPSPPPSAGPYYYDYSESFTDGSSELYGKQRSTQALQISSEANLTPLVRSETRSTMRIIPISKDTEISVKHHRKISKDSAAGAPTSISKHDPSLSSKDSNMPVSTTSISSRNNENQGCSMVKGNEVSTPILFNKQLVANSSIIDRLPPQSDTAFNQEYLFQSMWPPIQDSTEFRCRQSTSYKTRNDVSNTVRSEGADTIEHLVQSPQVDFSELSRGRPVPGNPQTESHYDGTVSRALTSDGTGLESNHQGNFGSRVGLSTDTGDNRSVSASWQLKTTPISQGRSSLMPSHGKSTIESLLDKHIESLGINPDPESPLGRLPTCSASTISTRTSGATTVSPMYPSTHQSTDHDDSEDRSLRAKEDRRYSDLVPRRLFANEATAGREDLSPSPQKRSKSQEQYRRPSLGWHTLASTSGGNLQSLHSKVSNSSGSLADIDSSANRRRFKVRRRSALSISNLPSETPSLQSLLAKDGHKRPRSEVLVRQESHRRRRLRIRIKRASKNIFNQTAVELAAESDSVGPTSLRPLAPAADAALIDNRQVAIQASPQQSSLCELRTSTTPQRWPTPLQSVSMTGPKKAELLRPGSTRTVRSHRSDRSLTEPINSTRLTTRVPQLGNNIPILAPPDLGPPLAVSQWDLSIPYAPEPSTIRPSIRNTNSYIEESAAGPATRGMRRLFGLASLRSILSSSSGLVAYTGPDAMCGRSPNLSDWHILSDTQSAPRDTLMEKRDGMMARVRGWWRSHCLQKHLATRQQRAVRGQPAGIVI